jgi:phycobilisome rod-core linker protein
MRFRFSSFITFADSFRFLDGSLPVFLPVCMGFSWVIVLRAWESNMSIPLLEYAPVSQNHRVEGFEVSGDEHSRIYTTENRLAVSDMDALIAAAYRQIYNEQQMLSHHREGALESQLRSGQITVKEFIEGLVTSDSFRRLTYDSNNNYRFVEICVQRVLGRNVYGDREKLAWSIVLATRGLQGFANELLRSDEYEDSFGNDIVPYQRRRILPQRAKGEVTFAHTARYGTDFRDKLPQPNMQALGGVGFTGPTMSPTRWAWQKNTPQGLIQTGRVLTLSGAAFIGFLFIAVLLGL